MGIQARDLPGYFQTHACVVSTTPGNDCVEAHDDYFQIDDNPTLPDVYFEADDKLTYPAGCSQIEDKLTHTDDYFQIPD